MSLPVFEPQSTDPAQFLADSDPLKVGRVARRLFLGITSDWALSDAERFQLLGMGDEQTYESWVRNEGVVSNTILERISLLAGTQQALLSLIPAESTASWIRHTNRAFDGRSALQVMLADGVSGMAQVRSHVETQLHR